MLIADGGGSTQTCFVGISDDVARGRTVLRSPSVPTLQPPSGVAQQRHAARVRRASSQPGVVQRTLRHTWQRA